MQVGHNLSVETAAAKLSPIYIAIPFRNLDGLFVTLSPVEFARSSPWWSWARSNICRYPIKTLFTEYSKADDRSLGKGVRLTQCPRCKRFADKYVEHDFVILFIDLVLIKPQVSLCFNVRLLRG